MANKIAQVVVGLPIDGPFDYSVDQNLRDAISIGQRVAVSFNRTRRVGYVVNLKEKSPIKRLNPVISILDEENPCLDDVSLALAEEFSAYYGCSLGEAIETSLPSFLRKSTVYNFPQKRLIEKPSASDTVVFQDVNADETWAFLKKKIQECLAKNKDVIFLIPEKVQMNFVSGQLKTIKPDLIIWGQSVKKQEINVFNNVRSISGTLVVGTRSAVFAPSKSLGLIVVYDEENTAYYQDQTPNYHVREVALLRKKIERADVVFTSASPTLELWHKAKKEKWTVITPKFKSLSSFQAVDMSNYNPRKTSLVSFPLQNKIQKTLEEKGKVLLFLNRRGFSVQTQCNQCGHVLKCERCDVNLTFLRQEKMLVCRKCSAKKDFPKVCPSCGSSYIRSVGSGIEKIENELAGYYPWARIVQYDKETSQLPQGADIVVATQAILELKELWKADLVGVLNFDAQLNRFDFRSADKAFGLLIHLRMLAGKILLVQTSMPDNYCIQAAKFMNFKKFYREELKYRKQLKLPPYRHYVNLHLRGPKQEEVSEVSSELYDQLKKNGPKAMDILEPVHDVDHKLRDKFRWIIMLKAASLKTILSYIKTTLKAFKRRKGIVITLSVDI